MSFSAVLVPPLGQTVDTLTLVSWYKNEGDAVVQGEPLFAVETDKATLDVEASASGMLRGVSAVAGDQVKGLTTIATIEELATPSAPGEQPMSTTTHRVFVSPRARRLAESEGVLLEEVKATGPMGAIIERDVLAHLKEIQKRREQETSKRQAATSPEIAPPQIQRAASPVAMRMAASGMLPSLDAGEAGIDWRTLSGSDPRGQITKQDIERAAAGPMAHAAAAGADQGIPLAGVRGLIAERMAASHRDTAAVTLTTEADATALVALRRQLAGDGVAVSYNDLFLTILAKALAEHPRLNASLAGDAIKVRPQIDLGLAVDTERGLMVPVVRAVNRKGLAQLAAETVDLAARARSGRCTPEELTGSTFTLTNLGMYGIDAFTPIINLPECAILGVGRIATQPVWVVDHVEPRERVWLSLTFDHRLVDGGPAARFLQRVAQLAEKPHLLIA